jgi:hypothetical protein
MAISIPISQHVILLQGALPKQNMATNKLSSGRLRAAMWSCSASSSDSEDPEHSGSTMPPKLEPFSQSRISRLTPEPSLLRKAEAALSDRCMALEGDKAYECWEALFKFEDIKVFVVHAYALQAPNFDCNDQCLKGVVVVCDSDSIFVMWLFCDEREREREK